MARLEVRLPDEELERWRVAAADAGWSLATLVRRGVGALLAAQRLPDGGLQGPQPFLASSSVVGTVTEASPDGLSGVVQLDPQPPIAVERRSVPRPPIASSELQPLTDDGEPTGRRTIHRHFPDGSVVTTETTAASEAAAAAATLPDPAVPARSRVPAAETACIHRVKAPAYCKQCGKQVGT